MTDTDVAPAPRTGPREYDWPAIRRRYVEGVLDREAGITHWPTLNEVADHFGVVPDRVRERSGRFGWRSDRAKWQAELEVRRRNARAAAMVQEATKLDGSALNAAKLGLQLCMTRLGEIGQAAQQARQNAGVGGVGGVVGSIDALEQQRLAQAVDLWHKVGLRAIGDPEVHRVEITGADGRPLEIGSELRRDNPDRIVGVLAVLERAGLGDLAPGLRAVGAAGGQAARGPNDDGDEGTDEARG